MKPAIRWRCVGPNGWDRKGTYLGHEIEIRYSHGSKHYEIRFGSTRYGTYGTSDEELARAKADAEKLLPGWIADRQAEHQARKDAEAEASKVAAEQNTRRAAVADRLRALGIPCTDAFGIMLTTEVAEMLADRLDTPSTRTKAKRSKLTA